MTIIMYQCVTVIGKLVYENAIYVIFSNPIGMDDDHLKNVSSIIIDSFLIMK
jgi:ABC-type uncharacterized transport system permease subunit